MGEQQNLQVNSRSDNPKSLATFLQAFVLELYGVGSLDAAVLSLYTGKWISAASSLQTPFMSGLLFSEGK